MSELILKPVTPGRLVPNPYAQLGPLTKSEDGAVVTAHVYLDGERIGFVVGTTAPGKTVREWARQPRRGRDHPARHARFNPVDALVRTHLTDLQRPIAHLGVAPGTRQTSERKVSPELEVLFVPRRAIQESPAR
ncbi:hypothetical protein [Arthrobacter sp. B1I2]|uniref:hypothetical protein n=1 Tax=Arthrobacter sp. B1I2 TaxID=3042263 RepID=UPI0027897A51|nr:hypothetical protein [Arthrobacter sp. B1I2]MDQ0732180.1 hypothetical protein [Arthrobacter sp. B1I2]